MNKLYYMASIIGIGASVACAFIATTIVETVLSGLLALAFTCVLVRYVVGIYRMKKFEQYIREQSEAEDDSCEEEDDQD